MVYSLSWLCTKALKYSVHGFYSDTQIFFIIWTMPFFYSVNVQERKDNGVVTVFHKISSVYPCFIPFFDLESMGSLFSLHMTTQIISINKHIFYSLNYTSHKRPKYIFKSIYSHKPSYFSCHITVHDKFLCLVFMICSYFCFCSPTARL